MSSDPRTEDERLVVKFFEDWLVCDADLLADYFTDDASYQDIGYAAQVGRENIRTHLIELFKGMTVRIETLHMASRDGVVFSDRIDHVRLTESGSSCSFPIVGVMEFRDGKIAAWREYLDVRGVEEALGLPDQRAVRGG